MNLKLTILLALVGIAFAAFGQSEVQNDLSKGSELSVEPSKDPQPSQNHQQSEASQPASVEAQSSGPPNPPPTGRPTGSPGPRTRRPGPRHHHKGKGTFYFDFIDKK
ncbi:unnamed protein product [Caenorhabditis nigoni]